MQYTYYYYQQAILLDTVESVYLQFLGEARNNIHVAHIGERAVSPRPYDGSAEQGRRVMNTPSLSDSLV